jgi:hypothetical protein
MSETIQPALTSSQWERRQFSFEYWGHCSLDSSGELVLRDQNHPSILKGQERHKLAALALLGQPFGFSREDVEALRDLAGGTREECDPIGDPGGAMLWSLADRIAALLPPETETPKP